MTFYFYDLETSGINPRRDRVMQFAGQRTDLDLQPIGEPDNILIKITPDILPDPEAILITGITPQQTLAEGITEAEFLKYFTQNIQKPDTIIVGFNNVRFDDEFMRFMFWRNFYDSYEWQWKDSCSRWDLLDMVRMTRALRPDGIKWPFATDNKPTNRLEYLTKLNNLSHKDAHNALSDVEAAIEVAKLIKRRQPKLFDYLLNIRIKHKVSELVNTNKPFLYTSGRYPSKFLHTTAVVKVGDCPDRQGSIVYDLREDPQKFIDLSPQALAELWCARGKEADYFPAKTLLYNRCPALAPLNALDNGSSERLEINEDQIKIHTAVIMSSPLFRDNLSKAYELTKKTFQPDLLLDPLTADEQLYNGFLGDEDKNKTASVRAATSKDVADLDISFSDERLNLLLPLYKARNFLGSMSSEDQEKWESFRKQKLLNGEQASQLAEFFNKLNKLAAKQKLDGDKKYLLEELNLYGQSITPVD